MLAATVMANVLVSVMQLLVTNVTRQQLVTMVSQMFKVILFIYSIFFKVLNHNFLGCDCNELGSVDPSCNDGGLCTCIHEKITGNKCDACVEGNTNFPFCDECTVGNTQNTCCGGDLIEIVERGERFGESM